MPAVNLKAETLAMIEKRDVMELEMNGIIARLTQNGGPGISGNLLDSEGFPRLDIDIPAVRSDRQRLAELRNDYKEITEKINENIVILHSTRLSQNVPLSQRNADGSLGAIDDDPTFVTPFAVIDEISNASPAAMDGLQLGDQIVKFGNVRLESDLLQSLAHEAQSNQGHPISLIVLRQGDTCPLERDTQTMEWSRSIRMSFPNAVI